MDEFRFYAANLFSLDCEQSAQMYSRLFSLSIISLSKKHSELQSRAGLVLFIDSPNEHCNVHPGSISFSVSKLKLEELNLFPLQLESYFPKQKYASFLDEYKNRIWIFEKE